MSKILSELRETEAARQQLRRELRLIRGGQNKVRHEWSRFDSGIFRKIDRPEARLRHGAGAAEEKTQQFKPAGLYQRMEVGMSPTEEYAQKILEKLRNCDNLTTLSRDYRDALTAVETFRSLAECNRRRAEEYCDLVQLLEKEISDLLAKPAVAEQGE